VAQVSSEFSGWLVLAIVGRTLIITPHNAAGKPVTAAAADVSLPEVMIYERGLFLRDAGQGTFVTISTEARRS
jgi:hypothetical protein